MKEIRFAIAKWNKLLCLSFFLLSLLPSFGQNNSAPVSYIPSEIKIQGPFYSNQEKRSDNKFLSDKVVQASFFITAPTKTYFLNSSVEYRLNLQGYHKAWIKIEGNKKIVFDSLVPGKYSLEVRMKESIDSPGYTSSIVNFEIEKNWLRKLWWQILSVLLLSALLIIFIRLYNRKLLIKKKELEKKVNEKTLQLQTSNEALEHKIKELNNTTASLIENNTQRERLLNILSHDINSPLRFSTMVGKAVLIKKEVLSKEEIIDALTDINQAGTRMLLLISNILKWGEYQKENFKPHFSNENLYQLVQDKMEFFRFMANAKNIELLNNIPADIFITTDKTAFGIIIQNLLNNAVKFTPDGEIEVTAAANKQYITLTISDTGVGMPKETIEAIEFGKTVVPMPDNENLKGNGLGWELINELLQHLNGTFEIKSGKGIGTTVTIVLPLLNN
jgi:signal transduction histidine kinase